jgi:SAM-dependent methyltransferase
VKRCLACSEGFTDDDWRCPKCGWSPTRVDGFLLFAPDPVSGDGGFDASSFARLAAAEDKNFWFRARNRLLVWSLGRYGSGARSFMEVGCGTGYVLKGLTAANGTLRFVGGEIYAEALPFAAARVSDAQLLQFDARQTPFEEEFDAIGAFDVLEHVIEDEAVLHELHRATKSDGLLMITVPQHPRLWTDLDARAHHVRRYRRSEIESKIRRSGFKIVRSTSFNFVLLPIMLFARMLRRLARLERVMPDELDIGRRTNAVFEYLMRMELALIRCGLSFPWGGSRLVVAVKTSGENQR